MKDISALVSVVDRSVNVNAADKSVSASEPESVSVENFQSSAVVANEPRRAQVGFFHVWIRGSNRYNVFYDTTDFVGFLERCQRSAEKNETVVSAFVLMDNHVHLQIYTRALNAFMRSLLMSFNQWFNRRKGLSGQLFNSPFSSKLIDNEEYLLYNYLYILTNPIRAGICENITKYRWSSYHFTKNGYYNYLGKFIEVSNLVNNYLFTSNNHLHLSALHHLKEFWSLEGTEGVNNKVKEHYKEKHIIRPTDHEVSTDLVFILQGRKLNEISRKELIRTMQILRDHGNATYRQISSVTHESFYDVVRMLKR
jgi:REP element-mobilizing transposase RayT